MDGAIVVGHRMLVLRFLRLAAMLETFVEKGALAARLDQGQQGVERVRNVADRADIDRMASPEMRAVDVDLDDRRVVRIILPPGEVAAEQQQGVARGECVESALRSENAGHPDVERIVIFEEILGARRVRDRRGEPVRERHHLIMRTLAAGAAVDRDPFALVQRLGDPRQFLVRRPDAGARAVDGEGRLVRRLRLRDVGRHDQHRDAFLRQRRLRRHCGASARLLGRRDLLAEDRAGRIDRLVIHLLREIEAELIAHDLARDQHHRRAVAVAFEQAVDEMQAAGPARSGAGRELPGQQRIRPGGEPARLLMPDMDPADGAAPDRVGDMVQRIARHAVAAFHACLLQRLDDDFGDGLAHGVAPCPAKAKAPNPATVPRRYHPVSLWPRI